MATQAKAARSRAPKSVEPRPEDLPDVYSSVCLGTCLEPMFRHGANIVFSRLEEPKSGDYVGVWLDPAEVDPGESTRRVKRLAMALMPGLAFPFKLAPASEIEPLVVLEQHNPPKLYHVRASHILAMHKVIGEAEPNGNGTSRMVRQWIGGKMMRYYPEPDQ